MVSSHCNDMEITNEIMISRIAVLGSAAMVATAVSLEC